MLVKSCEVVNYGLEFGDPLLLLVYFLLLMQFFSVRNGDFASENFLAIFDFVLGLFQLIFKASKLALQVYKKRGLAIHGIFTLFKLDFGLSILPLDVVQLFKHLTNFLLSVI